MMTNDGRRTTISFQHEPSIPEWTVSLLSLQGSFAGKRLAGIGGMLVVSALAILFNPATSFADCGDYLHVAVSPPAGRVHGQNTPITPCRACQGPGCRNQEHAPLAPEREIVVGLRDAVIPGRDRTADPPAPSSNGRAQSSLEIASPCDEGIFKPPRD